MRKKILLLVSSLLVTVTLVACGGSSLKVTFDTQGGTPVSAVTVKEGGLVEDPGMPTHVSQFFVGWFTTSNGEAGTEFNFRTTKVENDLTIYAVWTYDPVARFHTRSDVLVPAQKLAPGATATKPANPTRLGFRFGGWYTTKRGMYWLEKTPVEFPLTVNQQVDLYAYWEPIKSDAVNWSADETYRSTITKQSRMILNPLTYENSLENDLIANMATSLYSTEVDWAKAINDGVADSPGDFSKIIAGDFSIESLDYHYILVGAADYPLNEDGDNLLDENGNYDRDAATTRTSTEWTFQLRDDIYFQDGTQVTAHTYEYTLKQYLDKAQNNYRANSYYQTEENKNGVPILNAYEYHSQSVVKLDDAGQVVRDEDGKLVYEDKVVNWDEVGFKVLDDFTFKMTFWKPYTQSAAVGFGTFRLVHPQRYAASLDVSGNSNYGTPVNPYMSYGPYVLKSWDEDQKLIFNKNYDYVSRETINYKSLAYELVENTEQTLNLFREGSIDVIGLNADNFEEFAERKNIYRSFTGYPMFLTINTAPSSVEGPSRHVPDSILFDVRFRQALMYGFDRVDYNENWDIPNLPSFIPVPGDIKNYVQDPEFFTDSHQYLEVLQDLGVDPASHGYVPALALELFDLAYADWLAEGNSGPVTLKMIAPDSTISKKISARVKAMYESFFEKDGQKRLVIDLHNLASAQRSQTSAAWDFDLTLGGIGFGGSLGSYWQMGAISFLGSMLGGANLGLSQPYTTGPNGDRVIAEYVNQVIEIDLTATYNHLVNLGGAQYLIEADLLGTLDILEMLEEVKDDEGNVIKPAGIMRETVMDIILTLFGDDEPWDGSASEPFPGASNDANNIAAAMLKIFYQNVTHIPTGTSASAALYADKITIEWPSYSTAFGWGAARYRYLNTDPDFQ